MNDAQRANRLLDAALIVLTRAGTFTKEGDVKVATTRVGRADITMRGPAGTSTGPAKVQPRARPGRRRKPANSLRSSYVLEVRAPVPVLIVAWGGGDPIEVHLLIGGDWERLLVEAALADAGR